MVECSVSGKIGTLQHLHFRSCSRGINDFWRLSPGEKKMLNQVIVVANKQRSWKNPVGKTAKAIPLKSMPFWPEPSDKCHFLSRKLHSD